MKNYEVNIKTDNYNAKILQNLYADTSGEFASFLQFSYQQFCLLPFETPLKKTFDNIAQDDLEHTKILAKHLVELGQIPLMRNCDGKYLATKQINSETSQLNMILFDIDFKEKSIINYKSAIIKITNQNIKKSLNKIVCDEENHLKILKNILKILKEGKI